MAEFVQAEGAPAMGVQMGTPVVHVVRTKRVRGRKRGSSRGTRRLTSIERRVSKAVRRLTRATDRGMVTYLDHRDESREKRKDGAIVDLIENVSYGVSEALSKGSPVIHDVAEAYNTRRLRRQVRRAARYLRFIPLFG